MNKYVNNSYQDLQKIARENKGKYASADPFPSISFDNFFNPDILHEILSEFPDLSKGDAQKFNTDNSKKLAGKGENRFGPKTKEFCHFLNSQPFLEFLQELTSTERTLLPDPYFFGGGLHEIKRGGFLKVHADFNIHAQTGLDRRLNILVYLNEDWKEEYGGHLELWDKDMKQCVRKISPVFNTLAMFSTTDFSYHGHPDPLACPEDRSRKSLALYYYSNGRPAEEIDPNNEAHSTIYKKRNGLDSKITLRSVVKDLVPPIFVKMIKR